MAIAVALKADLCDIYTDVDGVYTTDPRIVPKARRLPKVSYEEMLEMASLGSKVLQTRSVELAMVHRMRMRVLSSFVAPEQMQAGAARHLGRDRHHRLRRGRDRGEAGRQRHRLREGRGQDHAAQDRGQARRRRRIFGPLAEANINVDMIVQNMSADGKRTDMTFTVHGGGAAARARGAEGRAQGIGYYDIKSSADVAKVSVIGIGMRSHAGVAAQMFKALAEKGINIQAISTSEIKISVLIDAAYAELAVRTLHSLYGLDAD